jgi:hypothetical protein
MDGNSITESFLGATKNGSVDGTKTFQTVTSVTYSKTDLASFEIGALHGNANETYTLTGVDVFGNTVSETMRGEGGALKALSNNVYASITSISTTTTAGSNVSIGNYNGEAQTGLGAIDVDGLYAEAQVANGANTPLAANASKDLGGVLITMVEGNNDTASNADITVTGTDMFDNVITEVITGPTKAGTVTGTKIFKTVTALSSSAASTSTKVKIGFKQAADDFTVRGNLTMSNSTGETIKIESVAENNDETMAVAND